MVIHVFFFKEIESGCPLKRTQHNFFMLLKMYWHEKEYNVSLISSPGSQKAMFVLSVLEAPDTKTNSLCVCVCVCV